MPLNYAKWDQLELSDDSDIEGHPNVDKRSLIRWKQRDIHEKRVQRNHKIAALQTEIASNDVLLRRLSTIAADLAATLSPPALFSSIVDSLQKNPSSDAPPVNHLGQPPSSTYDAMVLSLLLQVTDEAKKSRSDDSQSALATALIDGLNTHIKKLSDVQAAHRTELEQEEKEKAKRITTDDIHDGFENKYVPPKPSPAAASAPKKPKTTTTTTTTTYETLNPKAADPNPPEDDVEEDLPELTPSLIAFSHIPLRDYQQSWDFISEHPDVVVPNASDALLVAAFRAQSENGPYAKQCVHQSLLLQYCDKLGRDGVRLFFKKMIAGDQRAETVFLDDVEKTYAHIVSRVAASIAESEAGTTGTEQIQLVPENQDQTISFNVPDGPPPEHLVLEGPGTEDLDVDHVRRALQLRWDVFQAFSEDMRAALRAGTLDRVNKVLGSLPVPEAEHVVSQLDMAGILNFAGGGIRDETGKGKGVQKDDSNDDDDDDDDDDGAYEDAEQSPEDVD